MDSSLNSLKENNINGAALITGKILDVFTDFARNFDSERASGEFRDEFIKISKEILSAQPYMASNYRRIDSILKKLKHLEEKYKKSKDCINALLDIIDEEIKSHTESTNVCISFGSKLIKDGCTILTYSCSSTVESIIRETYKEKKNIKVILSESRPVKEGLGFAERLSEAGIKVTYVVDIVLPSMVEKSGIILLGTDWVAEDFFVNKIGTRQIVEEAYIFKTPVYLFCTTEKILSGKYIYRSGDNHDPDEVDEKLAKNENIEIYNPYFERIDYKWLNGIVTEKGLTGIEDIQSICSNVTLESELI